MASSAMRKNERQNIPLSPGAIQLILYSAAVQQAWGEYEWNAVSRWFAKAGNEVAQIVAERSYLPHLLASHTCGVPLLRGS